MINASDNVRKIIQTKADKSWAWVCGLTLLIRTLTQNDVRLLTWSVAHSLLHVAAFKRIRNPVGPAASIVQLQNNLTIVSGLWYSEGQLIRNRPFTKWFNVGSVSPRIGDLGKVGGSLMPESLRSPNDRISVLVITADNISAELLKSAFTHQRKKGYAVQTLTGSSQKVIGKLAEYKPDVALVCDELQNSPHGGFKVLQKLRESYHHTAAIMLLQCFKPDCVVEAFREGARGVFSRTHSLKALSKCIRTVYQGQYWASNQDLGHIMSALTHLKPLHFNDADGMPLLTRREDDVVRLVVDGLKNGEIAQRLNVAEHSIRNYLYRIFEKLGVSSRVELILYAFKQRDRSH